jgi:hypothetical protein
MRLRAQRSAAYPPTYQRTSAARARTPIGFAQRSLGSVKPFGQRADRSARRTFSRSGCVRSSYRSATTNLHGHQHARAFRRARAHTEAGICARAHASAGTQTHMPTRRVQGEGLGHPRGAVPSARLWRVRTQDARMCIAPHERPELRDRDKASQVQHFRFGVPAEPTNRRDGLQLTACAPQPLAPTRPTPALPRAGSMRARHDGCACGRSVLEAREVEELCAIIDLGPKPHLDEFHTPGQLTVAVTAAAAAATRRCCMQEICLELLLGFL